MAWPKKKAGKMVWTVNTISAIHSSDVLVRDAVEQKLNSLVAAHAFVHTIDFSGLIANHGIVRIVSCHREPFQKKATKKKPAVEPSVMTDG